MCVVFSECSQCDNEKYMVSLPISNILVVDTKLHLGSNNSNRN